MTEESESERVAGREVDALGTSTETLLVEIKVSRVAS
jgi:hypothetical protein